MSTTLHLIETEPSTDLNPVMNGRIIDGRVHLTAESHIGGDYIVSFEEASKIITNLKIENLALKGLLADARKNGGYIDTKSILEEAAFWLEGALNCKSWHWDQDQHVAASTCLSAIQAIIAPVEKVKPKPGEYPIAGFAPGGYMNKCTRCEETFMGDKRAYNCEPCALKIVGE